VRQKNICVKPLVSILIPAFNEARWIADTIASAIDQTWPHTEIIVVDDGSSDETAAIAKRFASANVKIATQPHQGASAARNLAFSLCQGDYIQWLDADDLLAPDKIERQLSALDRAACTRTVLSSAWGRFMHRRSRARFIPTALWHDLSPVEWLLRKLEFNVCMQTATWLVSRETTAAAGAWDTRLLVDDDGEYFCRVLLRSDAIRFVPEARVFYRLPDSTRLSHIGLSHAKMDSQFRSMQMHVAYLRSLEDSERVRAACVKYLQNGLVHFYPERTDIIEQTRQLVAELGGRLDAPRLPRKYASIRAVFGPSVARHAQVFLPRIRWAAARLWDTVRSPFE
jgi:glycosyltransferase involved in cell wall biosynthesis